MKGGISMSENQLHVFDLRNIKMNNSLANYEYLNLPDLQFFCMCQKKYKLNKGVFNTIDRWFYDYGVISVINRRIYILAFLDFVKEFEIDSENCKYIRFGHGGLSNKLNQFIRETEAGEYMI